MKTRIAKLEQAAQNLLNANAPHLTLWVGLDPAGEPGWCGVRPEDEQSAGLEAARLGKPVQLFLLPIRDEPRGLTLSEVHPDALEAIRGYLATRGPVVGFLLFNPRRA